MCYLESWRAAVLPELEAWVGDYTCGTGMFVAAVKCCLAWTVERDARVAYLVSASIAVAFSWSCCLLSLPGSCEVILSISALEANRG